MGHDEALNRIAIVYVDRQEYRVYAPAKAEGPAIDWLDLASVHQPDTSTYGSELQVNTSDSAFIIDCVRGELEKLRSETEEPVRAPVTAKKADEIVSRNDPIQLLCERFHQVARQLRARHAGRYTLDVRDEYDVQDLIHGLLRIFFDDVRPEEWTPNFAGASARMDFLVPEVRTVLETKKTREGLGAKEIGEQLIIDIAKYKEHPKCKRLICLVYDPDGRITNARGLETDLTKKHGELEVQVLIVPR